MPALSKIYSKYKDNGLIIFGLNSVDNQPNSLKNLKIFLGKRQLSYQIILTKPAVDIRHKINGYPSMYIIDKSGKLAFVDIGFSQNKLEALKKKVEALTR